MPVDIVDRINTMIDFEKMDEIDRIKSVLSCARDEIIALRNDMKDLKLDHKEEVSSLKNEIRHLDDELDRHKYDF